MTTSIPLITESQILTSYLLPPSPLPTIIPYSSFLSLVPATYRNNPEYAPAIKRLYRDLQFQRDITLSQVAENIERECGERAATMRAGLTKRIAIEEGQSDSDEAEVEVEAREQGLGRRQRKRRRVEHVSSGSNENDDLEDSNSENSNDNEHDDDTRSIKSEDGKSSDNEFNDHLHLQVQASFYNDPSTLHPASNVLPLSSSLAHNRMNLEMKSGYHTKKSLLEAMENASASLERETTDLEAECERIKNEIKETVGGLSDLRYGKSSRRHKDGEDGEATAQGEEFKEILDSLTQFKEMITADSDGP